MFTKGVRPWISMSLLAVCLIFTVNHLAQAAKSGGRSSGPEGILRVDEVVCDVGQVANRITNSTVEKATGDNNYCIMTGDDSQELPSMVRHIPEIYSGNSYLYYASLRLAYDGTLVGFSSDTSDSITVTEPPYSLSNFDTYFTISDDDASIPPDYARPGIEIAARTYAWATDDIDDFIIYDFWIKNTSDSAIEPLWVGFHADCDVSTAEGGSGYTSYNRDDLVGYVRDTLRREYISYTYDGDNPYVQGDDTGGNKEPKESSGYIGTRLLYCPQNMNGDPQGTQSGHSYWDWNNFPYTPQDWYVRITDGIWMDPPSSVHDYTHLQKLGPFFVPSRDSIHVVFAFGVGEGLTGLRHVMNNAKMLYDSGYTRRDFPPEPPRDLRAVAGNHSADLVWKRSPESDVVGYEVFRKKHQEQFEQIGYNSVEDTTFHDVVDSNYVFYYYALRAVDEAGFRSLLCDSVVAFPYNWPNKLILLVNGVQWERYGDELMRFYEARSMTGDFPFLFWDLFTDPPAGGYPSGCEPIFTGGMPGEVMEAFSTLIWVGNNYSGDLVHWENAQTDIMEHLHTGGNLILVARYGASFFENTELEAWCHITEWSRTVSITESNPLVSTTYSPDIVDVGPGNGYTSASLAQMCHTDGHPYVTEIFRFTIDTEDWIGGFRVQYPGEGQFVFVSGRPYRLDLEAQRHNYSHILKEWFGEPLDVGDEGKGALPREFALYQNYPNPFNPATLIKFDLPQPAHVKLEIFNLLGQRVTRLVDEVRNAGRYSFIWNGRNQSGEEVASGVFFYRIEAGDYTKVRKMTILR